MRVEPSGRHSVSSLAQSDVGFVPTAQGNDESLRARVEQGMNLGVATSLGPSHGL